MKMSGRTVIAATALVAVTTVVATAAAAPSARRTDASRPITVRLHAVNGSGQSGVAILTPTAHGYIVAVRMSGRNVQLGEPDHIHNRTCARYARIAPHPKTPTFAQFNKQLATVKVGLNDIYRRTSETEVSTPLSDVTKGGYSINVHDPNYPYPAVACGDIPRR